ncbi:MAG: hypothetical protein AAFO87_18070, partial [Cyanobacteria bacterium J06607_6]
MIDGEPLPWAWPDGLEIAWIVTLTGIGSGLMVLTQRGPVLILFGVSGLALTFLVGVASFQGGGWVSTIRPLPMPVSATIHAISNPSGQAHGSGSPSITAERIL